MPRSKARYVRNTKGPGKVGIMDVNIVDPVAGKDGSRVDRAIQAIKASESQTTILIGDVVDVNATTAAQASGYDFISILATDDFQSFLVQYNMFRIRHIKFDIYDLNTNVAVPNAWGIWHDNYEASAPAYTRANIADLPDSRVLSAGTGQTTLYWVAHGVDELKFQETSNLGSPLQAFGGLKYYVGTTGAAVQKYTIQIHAVVDFRARR